MRSRYSRRWQKDDEKIQTEKRSKAGICGIADVHGDPDRDGSDDDMAGYVEERSCWWCRWHSWDYDECILSGRLITGADSECCEKHMTDEEYYESLEKK